MSKKNMLRILGIFAIGFAYGAVYNPMYIRYMFYDAMLGDVTDALEQARGMLSRLYSPLHLATSKRMCFSQHLDDVFENICVHFGARGYWQGFEQMLGCGLLNEANISDVIGLLSRFSDGTAVAYLLDLKRKCFGKACFDYGL